MKIENDEVINNLFSVLGFIAVKELKTIEEKIEILVRLGYENKDIAIICGSSAGVVRTIKYNIIKKQKREKNGKRKNEIER